MPTRAASEEKAPVVEPEPVIEPEPVMAAEPAPAPAEGGAVDLYAKREDCNSGLAFGGNKIRKLEYIIPDAIASSSVMLRAKFCSTSMSRIVSVPVSAPKKTTSIPPS